MQDSWNTWPQSRTLKDEHKCDVQIEQDGRSMAVRGILYAILSVGIEWALKIELNKVVQGLNN